MKTLLAAIALMLGLSACASGGGYNQPQPYHHGRYSHCHYETQFTGYYHHRAQYRRVRYCN